MRFQVWFDIDLFVSQSKSGFLQYLRWFHQHDVNLSVIQAPTLSLLITSHPYQFPWILATSFSKLTTRTDLRWLRNQAQFDNLILPLSYVNHWVHARRGTCNHSCNTHSWNTDLSESYFAEGRFVYRYRFD